MPKKYVEIPASYHVGGTLVEVRRPTNCDDFVAGCSFLAAGYIEIAEKLSKEETQSDGSKRNTFYHELVHTILDTMGETDLSKNEKFVSCFSSFLNEALEKAVFEE